MGILSAFWVCSGMQVGTILDSTLNSTVFREGKIKNKIVLNWLRNASSRTPQSCIFCFLYPESQQPHFLDFHHYNICLSFLRDQNRGTACLNFWVVYARFLVLNQLYHFLTIMHHIHDFRFLLDKARLSSLNLNLRSLLHLAQSTQASFPVPWPFSVWAWIKAETSIVESLLKFLPKDVMGWIRLMWIEEWGDYRTEDMIQAFWRAALGAGPSEGDKSPHITSSARLFVAGLYVKIKASGRCVPTPGPAFIPASQHTEFPHPPRSELGRLHCSVTAGVSA